MDWAREFLEDLKGREDFQGNILGLLNVLIGRRVEKADGTLVSNGLTWRELAGLLKKVRWDKEAVRQLGLEPGNLPPRDRERLWYAAIAHARVDSEAATQAGDRMAEALRAIGYIVGPPPGR
jgi:hypothetical protein